jgi:hypothetical protein
MKGVGHDARVLAVSYLDRSAQLNHRIFKFAAYVSFEFLHYSGVPLFDPYLGTQSDRIGALFAPN